MYSEDEGRLIEISFELDSVTSNYNQFMETVSGINGIELFVMNPYINGIDIYNVKEHSLVQRLIFPNEGPNGIETIAGFHVFNRDSILVFSQKSLDGLFVINGKPGKRVSDFIELEPRYANFHIATAVPIIEFDQKLFLYAFPLKRDPDFSDYHDLDVVLDFDKKHVERVFSDLLFEDVQKWGKLRFPTRCLDPVNGKLVYSYPFMDELLLYDIRDKTIRRKIMKSKFFDNVTQPQKNYASKNAFLRENWYYDAMVYNSYTNRYYRFARHYIDENSLLGEKRTVNHQPISIIVADDQFRVLDELILTKPTKYLMKDFFTTGSGLYISNANKYNDEVNEDYMSFYLINY